MFWRGLAIHALPLVVAIGAALFLLLWIMGASAIEGEDASRGFTVGAAALFLYPANYQVFILAWLVCRWQKWSLARLFMQLIWFSLMLFVGAMAYALSALAPYLQS